jgi:geranylgeranyl diphosphate synthase, type II
MSTSVDAYLEQKKIIIDRALSEFLPDPGTTQVAAAMNYSVKAGGKRLRPILALAAAETFGVNAESIIEIASALELVHSYSLIHDDLPAMDDSDLRRGRPSCHVAFNEAIAILAGDALLTLAFKLVAAYGLREHKEKEALKICISLAEAAGSEGMIGGQELDLMAEGKILSAAEIETIAELKTGALFRAAIRCGALAASAPDHEMEILDCYAGGLGKAFQIIDDLLDEEGTAAELGKPAGADRTSAKATHAAAMGKTAARARADLLYREAIEKLKELHRDTEILAALAAKLVYRKK